MIRKKTLALILCAVMMPITAYAGNLDSPGDPSLGSGMPTLQGIYDQLNTGTPAGSSPSFQEPTGGPTAGTGKSLSDIQSKLPAANNTTGATGADVLSGKTFWGLRTDGTWGLKTGSLSSRDNVTGGNGLLNFAIPDGYYWGKSATANDANLVTGNIKSGATIFGIAGDANVVNTGGATAVAGDMLLGDTAYVNGSLVTGTVPAGTNITGGNGITTITIADGLYSGSKTATASDTNLAPANIKCGTTLFGITGWHKCKVATTGQTTSYGTGDDGYYHVMYGVNPAVAPGTTYNRTSIGGWTSSSGNGFVDNGDGTVTDNLTGLIWLKNANCFGGQPWTTALNSANTLASGACGLSDGSIAGNWRLPNTNELQSLIDPSRSNPALPIGHPFYGVMLDNNYWSSTTDAGYTDGAWFVNMNDGGVYGHYKYNSFYVWPVRSGQ